MKRDAKDRMDFDELFNHPFLKTVPRISSPVPVPSRRSVSPKASPSPVSPCGSPVQVGVVRKWPKLLPPSNLGEENKYNDHEVNKNSPMKHQLSILIYHHPKSLSPTKHSRNLHIIPTSILQLKLSATRQQYQTPHMKMKELVPCRYLRNTPASSPLEGFDMAKKMVSPETRATPVERTRRESTNSTGSDVFRFTDISSFTPPTVQFTIGTPPSGGRLRSFSGSTPPPPGSGRQTPTGWRHQNTSPQNLSGSPLRRSGSTPPPTCRMPSPPCRELRRCEPYRPTEHRAHRCLDFRNNVPVPVRAGRAMTLPNLIPGIYGQV
ncbi:hypothetical protein CEXT_345621 [Caerostris extrusa]|uniref:Uncharacterized protein n=1 Tax=Caerostris extrusa TaxID=172846 RepID=A0AAV4PT74_CAEEX|nr:hypothetical protein CEXT_345621 [Caerostris extrusa]